MFVRQVETLFSDGKHRVLAAKLKLDEETQYLVEAEERRGVELTWDAMRVLLLSKQKSGGSSVEFNIFQQREGESLLAAWDRLLTLARTAGVQMSTSQLWDYFRVRVVGSTAVLYRKELRNPDPFVALRKIRNWGDVASLAPAPLPAPASAPAPAPTPALASAAPSFLPPPSKSIYFGARDSPSDMGDRKPFRKGECFICHKPGHYARECPNSSDDNPFPSSRPSFPGRKHFRGRGGGNGGSHHRGRGRERRGGGRPNFNGKRKNKHWHDKPKGGAGKKDEEPKDQPKDPKALALGVDKGSKSAASGSSAIQVIKAYSAL